jgi:hypothetical protein
MFKSLRWQLTIRYVWLSALVYLIFGFISIGIFRTSLTAALDHELQALSVEACHDIDLRGNAPHIVDWKISWKLNHEFPLLSLSCLT